MKVFDQHRAEYESYGLTCELWEGSIMPRFDQHNEIELNFLLDGDITYFIQDRHVTVPAHKIAIFWGLVPHKIIKANTLAKYYVFTIPLSIFLDWGLPEDFTSRILHGEILVDDIDERYFHYDSLLFENWHYDMQNEKKHRMVLLEIQSRLLRMSTHSIAGTLQLSSPLDNKSKLIERMALFIAKNYHRPILLEDIGRAVNLHPDYANDLFKKAFGHTLIAHLTIERIRHAQRLLLTTMNPIVQIAYDCGFNSISCFNSTFKKYNKCTPRSYRNRMKTSHKNHDLAIS